MRDRGFRWIYPGSLLAVLLWMAASAGFALYAAHFSSSNKTYGTLAGVIVFLVWLWISNLAVLLGLEFGAELYRERAIEGGLPKGDEPYVRPRETRPWSVGGDREGRTAAPGRTRDACGRRHRVGVVARRRS